jgi:hypothetical protein
MPTLASELRGKLERVVIDARVAAEAGARAALEALAAHHYEPYPHMQPPERKLRIHLRARARQLGDRQDGSGRLAIDHLVGECAYEHWHRMLFARFLAENNLLIEPRENMAISLTEAEELAKEDEVDVWVFASRCAQGMLPQIFRPDDPLLQVSFATEHMLKLEKLLVSLPAAVFTASDALGWVYQFWQSKKKDEVNRSGVKIGADEISAVTQLFTEPYMVEFLLHNTLGAWWAGKTLRPEDGASAKTEDELRAKLALPGVGWEYLRFVRGADGEGGPWRPAAGTFDGWPKTAAGIKVLDPCCGSGHFLVAALHHLVPIRMAEEGMPAAEAIDAVLRDNLHGLEIDERCCQIAAFALAFAAWTYPNAGGYRPLPNLHVACTGIGPQATEEQWLGLAEQSGIPMPTVGREAIKNGLLNLHQLFSQAPTLGSLINPARLPSDLIAADYETVQPYLAAVLKAETSDNELRERAIAAAGMVKAAELLDGGFTLVITNVPYLGRGKQDDTLKAHLENRYKEGKADLATGFALRCLEYCANGGSIGLVTPQNWLFLSTYRKLREMLLEHNMWRFVARLGPNAFQDMNWWAATTALLIVGTERASTGHRVYGTDVSSHKDQPDKAELLRGESISGHISPIECTEQDSLLTDADARIVLRDADELPVLSAYASSNTGLQTGDNDRHSFLFWELPFLGKGWEFFHRTSEANCLYGGRIRILRWDDGKGALVAEPGSVIRGLNCRGARGVLVHRMNQLPATLFTGDMFDQNGAAIVPHNGSDLSAIWCYVTSSNFRAEVRVLDTKTGVTPSTLVKVPFDLAYWQKVAAGEYPDGLPEPESDDPTQGLFHGHPYEADEEATMQVAVARLLGYRWPAELDDEMHLSKRARTLVKRCEDLAKFADDDGIVCIPSVRGEEPAAERLFSLLTACDIEPAVDLDEWLRNDFFREHCELFHHRPFVWHIWDGRNRDGLHALVNYHKLCERGGKGRKLLESLTYSYLGDWISRQRDGVKRGEGGAEDRLAAALELQKRLEAILAGEPPFDLFVRWKPLHEQPIGWEPDINDGVRVNIRSFMCQDMPDGRKGADLPGGRTGAGILRWKPNIKWTKDRGKEPDRPKADYPWFWNWDERTEDFMGTGKEPDGNRWNNCHYTNKTKQAARDAAKKGGM